VRSTSHALLNPVRSWAAVVERIRSYVSAVWRNNRIEHITSKEIIDAINVSAEAIGWDKLGVKKGEFGTHSIRSGGAMAMYLDEIPIYTIMLIGRWLSDAFLRYIRKQVDQFTYNIAERMLKHLDFRHLPLVDQPPHRGCFAWLSAE
jgi:NADH/NAD ratio-sensing transcriptional regulator Rex